MCGPVAINATGQRVQRRQPDRGVREDLTGSLNAGRVVTRQLWSTMLAPGCQDVGGDLQVALQGQMWTEAEALVLAMLSDEDALSTGWNVEGFMVPVERRHRLKGAPKAVSVRGGRQHAPPDIRSRQASDRSASDAGEHLGAEAMPEDRHVLRKCILNQTLLFVDPTNRIVDAVIATQ